MHTSLLLESQFFLVWDFSEDTLLAIMGAEKCCINNG
jgi:hypothetical protein